ncbi:flavodoxin family protein [Treponema sp. C6A8]|nr:flavodoxin family protein [Treponema sp. C6A8]
MKKLIVYYSMEGNTHYIADVWEKETKFRILRGGIN